MGIRASRARPETETSPQPGLNAVHPIEVFAADLPAEDNCTFSSNETLLPSPTDVRARAEQDGIDTSRSFRPDPVRFPELGLIVKWGEDVTVAEGQCLWFIKRHLEHSVAVPKIFGWRQDGNQTFLYLELIHGDTLASRWNGLRQAEKATVCEQLRNMIASWRRIEKPREAGTVLSQIGGQALRDIMFSDAGNYPAGPFSTVTAFHDFFGGLASRKRSRREIEELAGLKDDVSTCFTHDDLDQSNILISKVNDGPIRIVAIIDWHQSGWYPKDWEILKAQSVGEPESDWVKMYLPTMLDEPDFDYYYAWEFVSMAII